MKPAMKCSPGSIEIRLLDWEDETFAVRSFTPSERLDASLERHGCLFQPWVRQKEKQEYQIVDGFKRLHWARERGRERVECIIFEQQSPPASLMVRRMEAKLFGPPLNVAEKAQVVAKLASVLPQQEVISQFFPALSIPSRPEALTGWCRLAAAGEPLLEAAALETVSERAAMELVTWEEGALQAMLVLLVELRCSASIQMEILERVTEIALGQGRKRADLLHESELKGISGDSKLNHRQKTQALRELLVRYRFPRLRAREERFARDLSQAKLPRQLRLAPPPSFEGEQWRLQLSFSRPEELESLLEETRFFARSSELRTLMRK
jgi:ParB family chromosome partitioning protein